MRLKFLFLLSLTALDPVKGSKFQLINLQTFLNYSSIIFLHDCVFYNNFHNEHGVYLIRFVATVKRPTFGTSLTKTGEMVLL